MYLICKDFSMLTGQTGLPPNQPTSLKVKNVHNFGIFQPIWLKLGMQSLNGRTKHMYLICKDFSMLTGQTGLLPNQSTSLKVKNVHNSGIFQPIWLKLGMQSLDGRTQLMNLIYKDFSMLTGLPPNQPATFKMINVHNLNNFQSIWRYQTALSQEWLRGKLLWLHTYIKSFHFESAYQVYTKLIKNCSSYAHLSF